MRPLGFRLSAAAVLAFLLAAAGFAPLAYAYQLNATGSNPLTFGVGATSSTVVEKMRISSGGLIGVGMTSPTSTFSVSGTISATTFVGNGSGLTNVTAGAGTFASLTDVSYSSVAGNIFGPGSLTGATSSVTNSVALGVSALANASNSGYLNVGLGYQALYSNTAGHHNTATGAYALYSNTTGTYNAAIGGQSLYYNTAGTYNTAMGYQSLFHNTTGSNNFGLGYASINTNATGSNNVAIGPQALYYPDPVTGTVAIGYNAGQGSSGGYSYGTYIGTAAGFSVTIGSQNTFFGAYAGDSVTTGATNIAIGYNVDTPAPAVSNYLNIGNAISGSMLTGGSLTIIGGLKANGVVTATYFEGDGSRLTSVSAGDDITSGTTNVTVNSTGYISLTTGGVTTGYFNTSGQLVAPGMGLGISIPQALLDISGSVAGNAMLLRSGDAGAVASSSGGTQIRFGYNGTNSYMHSIRTRHSSGSAALNAIDFWLWNYGVDTSSTLGSYRAMTIAGNGVGIGTTVASSTLTISTSTLADGILIMSPIQTAIGLTVSNTAGQLTLGISGGLNQYANGVVAGDTILRSLQSGTNTSNLVLAALTTSGTISFRTGAIASDTEKMRISNAGNVGIGNTSPSTKLEVTGTVSATAFSGDGSSLTGINDITSGTTYVQTQSGGTVLVSGSMYINNAISGSDAALRIGVNPSGNHYAYIDMAGDTTYTGYGLRIIRYNTGPNAASQIFHRGTGDLTLYAQDAGAIAFLTNSVERMRILSTGLVGIGTNAPAVTLHVSGTLRVQNGAVVTCNIGTGTGTTSCTSDKRLKTDITTIPDSLEKLTKLSGVTFHWKDPSAPKGEHLGVIAQDVETVFPQAVATMENGYKTVDYGVLVAPLIEAVKELRTENLALKAEQQRTNARLEALERQLHPVK